MSDVIYSDRHVFDGGPPLRLQRSLGLVKPDQPRAIRRALLAAGISWVPLGLVTVLQTWRFADSSANSFFSDFSVHARYLIALPALIFAESDCIPRFERIVRHFMDIGLIPDSDMQRYRVAVQSTRRLLNSRYGEMIVPLVSYLSVIPMMLYLSSDFIPQWQLTPAGSFSVAGWWHLLVSLPLLLILVFGWLWRIVLWARFLMLMASLDLQLLSSHPDSVGGLRFVSTSLRGFRFISFALGAVVAGAIADRIAYQGADLLSFKALMIGLMVLILILCVGPLMVFVRRLRETKKRGIFEYGGLANRLGREFEAKWLRSESPNKLEMLEAPDFSATTDYFSVAANVYEMRDLPFKAKDLIAPILPALVPFLAVALFRIPFQVVLKTLVKLLF